MGDLGGLREEAKGRQLPDVDLASMDLANSAFKKNTSTSTDGWHPREVKQLPPGARRALGRLMGTISKKA